MRRNHLFIALLSAALCAPVMAKAQTGYYSYAPVYNTTSAGQNYYTTDSSGAAPVYNNSNMTPPISVQQYIAGKNAPSYNFNNNPNQIQPYNGFGTQGPAPGTPAYVQMQNQQFRQTYQQQLELQQQQQTAGDYVQRQPPLPGTVPGTGYNPSNVGTNTYLSGLSGGPFGTAPQQQVPKKRRVIYKQLNDPLKEPARLFDPNQ